MTRERYESISLHDLREIAKNRGMRRISTLKKADLIDAMLKRDEEEARILREERMQKAADFLKGRHDFSSFCTAKPDRPNHVRTIEAISVERSGDMITVTITGDGFLYNMVRIIVGTLLRVGGGQMEPEEMKTVLEAKDRSLAGDTARPEGLTLVSIEYL